MIEFRWYVEDDRPPVLQYRQKYDARVFAGMGPYSGEPNMKWSSWITVQTVYKNVSMD